MKTKVITTIMITLFLASILSMAFVAPVAATPDSGIVGLWHFDKEFGTALDFEGDDDYVEVPDDPLGSLDITDVITIEAWVKVDSWPVAGPHEYFPIVDKCLGSDSAYALGVYNKGSGSDHYLAFYDATAWRYGDSVLNTGVWYHVVVSYDGSNANFYLNGVPDGSPVAAASLGENDQPIKIGYRYWSAIYYWYADGIIDEVRISNIARDPPFDLTGPLTADGNTVGLWHFDEGAGSTTADSSPNGNTGYLGDPLVIGDLAEPTWVDTTLAPDTSTNNNFGTLHNFVSPYGWVPGKFDKALDFDGVDDRVEVADSASLDITGSITLAAWVKPAVSADEEAVWRPIVSKWDDVSDGGYEDFRTYFLAIRGDGDTFCFYVNGPTGAYTATFVDSATVPKAGNWYFVAGTWDSTTKDGKIYVNGVLENTKTLNIPSIFVNDRPLLIGSGDVGAFSRKYWNGVIDEVCIWNVALTADQIKVLSHPAGTQVEEETLPLAGTVIFTSAFYLGAGTVGTTQTRTICIVPYDSSITISWVELRTPQSFTPKGTTGSLDSVTLNAWSAEVTVTSVDCKSIHLWLYLSTGERLGVNIQFLPYD